MPLTMTTRSRDGRVSVALDGDLDLAALPHVAQQIAAVLADPATSRLDIDLARVAFIESAAIGVLVKARGTAAARGCVCVVVNPSDWVRHVLRVAGVLEELTTRARLSIVDDID